MFEWRNIKLSLPPTFILMAVVLVTHYFTDAAFNADFVGLFKNKFYLAFTYAIVAYVFNFKLVLQPNRKLVWMGVNYVFWIFFVIIAQML